MTSTLYLYSLQSYLEPIVRPATELEHAGLLVKREILDVDLTGGLVNGRRLPLDQTLVVDRRLGGQRHFEVAVRAASQLTTTSKRTRGVTMHKFHEEMCTYMAVRSADMWPTS